MQLEFHDAGHILGSAVMTACSAKPGEG